MSKVILWRIQINCNSSHKPKQMQNAFNERAKHTNPKSVETSLGCDKLLRIDLQDDGYIATFCHSVGPGKIQSLFIFLILLNERITYNEKFSFFISLHNHMYFNVKEWAQQPLDWWSVHVTNNS